MPKSTKNITKKGGNKITKTTKTKGTKRGGNKSSKQKGGGWGVERNSKWI